MEDKSASWPWGEKATRTDEEHERVSLEAQGRLEQGATGSDVVEVVEQRSTACTMSLPSPVAEETSAPNEEPAPVPETASQSHPVLSKNAQKRLLKAQRKEEFKAERRARDKALKKAKKAELREKRARGELDDDEEEKARQVKRQKLSHDGPKEKFRARLVIDLGFDDKMTDRVSLSSLNPSPSSHFPKKACLTWPD